MRRSAFWCFTLLVFAAFPAAAQDEKKPTDTKKPRIAKIAHIHLKGDLDEAPVDDEPLFGPSGENLRMTLDRIRKAGADPDIKALLLEIEGLELGTFSFGKVEEVRRAISDFRKTGKNAYAYLPSAGGMDLLIALACEEVVLPESGSLELTGLRIELQFFKDLLDKVRVKGDFLQMGDFKGAAEPYMRNSMSPENRTQFETIMDDFYENSYVGTIIASRPAKKWTPADVKKLIDHGPYSARSAHKLGLIDKLAYLSDYEAELLQRLQADKTEIVRDYGKAKGSEPDFSNPFSLLSMLSPKKKKPSDKPKIAVIYAVGEIIDGKSSAGLFGGDSVGSTTMVEAIREAAKDATVKAIVLRVDSPGGSALASDLIWKALREAKKPVIASMGDIAASGGYYISIGCDKVFAEPGTLTGSIGVVGGKIVLGGLFEWAGVKTEVVSRGANSGANSSSTGFSESERRAVKALMEEVYDQFLTKTLESRARVGVKMAKEDLRKLAGGRIWTGRQAKAAGLVDELGTLDDAIAAAKVAARLPADSTTELLILPKPTRFLDRLLEGDGLGLRTSVSQTALASFAAKLPPELRDSFRAVEGVLKMHRQRVWLMLPYRLRVH